MAVSHCFPLSFTDNPELPGVDGILQVQDKKKGLFVLLLM